jgi:hypothetical protein
VGADPPRGKAQTYFLFINRGRWTRLWTNITPGRVAGGQCLPNANWNAKVPAMLVHEGRVYDVQVRYQGSPYNRMNGPTVMGFPADKGPSQPAPVRALGWHISFPRYAPLARAKRDLILNKRANECNFLRSGVGGMIFESVGLPSSRIGYARLFVNGQYLHFYSDFEHPDADMLKRFFGGSHVVGDYFKAVGWNGEQGPYTWADGRDITVNACRQQFTPLQLYTYNYDRAAPEWKSTSDEPMKMVKDFNAAKAAGPDALKRFFNEVFDYRLLLNYIAVINWMIPWDDFFQNHFLYRRSDGKWMFTPWDFDLMMGDFVSDQDRAAGLTSVQSSFYIGELDDRSNRVVGGVKWNNFIKDAFIKTYREELHQRLRELASKELAPAAIDAHIAKQLAGYDMAEASTALSRAVCNPTGLAGRIRSFATGRNARVAAGQFR